MYYLFYYLSCRFDRSQKLFARRELYEIMKDCKGKKFDEKFSLLEEHLVTVIKYPIDQKSTLTRNTNVFQRRIRASSRYT